MRHFRYKYLTQVPVSGLDAMVAALRLGSGVEGGCDAVVIEIRLLDIVFVFVSVCGLLLLVGGKRNAPPVY